MTKILCPHCNQEYDVEESVLGQECECGKCGNSFIAEASAPKEPTKLNIPNTDAANASDDPDGNFDIDLNDALKTLKTTNWYEVIPLKSILSVANLSKPMVRFCLFLTLFPLLIYKVMSWFINSADWGMAHLFAPVSFYFGMIWVLIFGSQLKVKQKLLIRSLGYMLFTAVIGMVICFSLYKIPFFEDLSSSASGNEGLMASLRGYCLAVGPIEEFTKMIPLLILGIKMKKITNARNGLFLGMASGVGFAITEGYRYIGNGAIENYLSNGNDCGIGILQQVFVRSLSLSFLHAAWCAIIGYVIGNCIKNNVKTKWPLIMIAWIFSALLHGLYDTFCGNIIGCVATVSATVIIFACMVEKAKEEFSLANATAADTIVG